MSEGSSVDGTATVLGVAEAMSRGARIRARRERMSWSARAFADRAGMSRTTLEKVEADDPTVRETSYTAAERALDDLADELGFQREDAGLVRIEVQIDGARAIVVQGPVDSIEELEESVARILKRMREQDS